MENIKPIKMILIAALTALTSVVGVLIVPLILLIISMVIDYVVGIAAAVHRGEAINSKRSIKGIIKKVTMLLLVVAGVITDLLLFYLFESLKWNITLTFAVACLICVWLLVNELISIIENIEVIGVKVPFFLPLVKWIQKKVGDKIKLPEEINAKEESNNKE